MQNAKRKQWSARFGDNKGKPWPAKNIITFLRTFSTAKAKPKAKAKAQAIAKAKAWIRMQHGMGFRVLGANILA